MRLLLLCAIAIVSLITSTPIQAQVEKQPAENTVEKKVTEQTEEEKEYVFTKIEIEAHTDRAKWDEHIRKGTILPESVLKKIPSGTYPALVVFIVDQNGGVSDIKLVDDPGYGLGQRALKVIRSYPGTWKPAIQCGRHVKAFKKQPVTFIVR